MLIILNIVYQEKE